MFVLYCQYILIGIYYRRKATELDGSYVKAWVRLGLAEFELKNYSQAHDAYEEAVRLTPASDNNWEVYMNKKDICKQKMDEMELDDNNDNNNAGMPDLGNLAGMFGGQNPADLLKGMGGMDGLSNLMKNPMMQQMYVLILIIH